MFKCRKILLLFCLFILLRGISLSQDTSGIRNDSVRAVTKSDTAYSPVKFILADHKYSYINPVNPDTVTRKRFLWYPTKNFEDVFNYLPGYYLNYMDVGQLNPVRFNQLEFENTATLRNGRTVEDFIDGKTDWNLFSRNEVEAIEVTNGFGNFLYTDYNAINIIQRQIFQNRPYTEISFINDRYENLYFDGNYHQNIFRNLNLNFGITKHSYEGKYINSDFDKWLGRFNLNFAISKRLNFFTYVNYAKIQKGLNEGINPDTVNIGNKTVMFDPELAIVRNSDSYEKKERFDVDAGAVFLASENFFTKLQLFVSNSFKEYRDEENRLNSNGIFRTRNEHWINYGVKLMQIFNFNIIRKLKVTSRTEGEFNSIADYKSTSPRRYYLLQSVNINYENFNLTEYVRWRTFNDFKYIYYNHGGKLSYKIPFDTSRSLNFSAFYNSYKYYSGAEVELITRNLNAKSAFYIFESYEGNSKKWFSGLNNLLNFRLYKFDFSGLFAYNISRDEIVDYIPKYSGNLEIAFHDVTFKNKLEYKIGLTTRFWSKYRLGRYFGNGNGFGYYTIDTVHFNMILSNLHTPANATLDFYIMGKIGRATFGLTMENILDRVIYNTGVYPGIDRGGLANVISRFNITWSFFD